MFTYNICTFHSLTCFFSCYTFVCTHCTCSLYKKHIRVICSVLYSVYPITVSFIFILHVKTHTHFILVFYVLHTTFKIVLHSSCRNLLHSTCRNVLYTTCRNVLYSSCRNYCTACVEMYYTAREVIYCTALV